RKQVLHRTKAHGLTEAIEERRSRECRRLRELGHRPRAREVTVHLTYRWRDPWIAQAAQEPWWSVTRRRPQCFDEQHLYQTREHEVATGSLLLRFVADEPDQGREPLHPTNVHHRGQQRHHQRSVGRVEDEVATQQPHVGATAPRTMTDLALR